MALKVFPPQETSFIFISDEDFVAKSLEINTSKLQNKNNFFLNLIKKINESFQSLYIAKKVLKINNKKDNYYF